MHKLPQKLSNKLKDLCDSFDKTKRNWRKASNNFNDIASSLSKEEWRENKQEITENIIRRLRSMFSSAEQQQPPAPNIPQYANNAIRNIENRIR